MKRPFALLGGCAFFTLAAAAVLGADFALISAYVCAGAGLCAVFVLCAVKWKRKAKKLPDSKAPGAFLLSGAAALFTAALCLSLFARAWGERVRPMESLDGLKARIRGTILDYPEQAYGKCYYKVRVSYVTVDGRAQELPEFTLRFSTWMPLSCEPWDTLECTVAFSAFDSAGGLYSSRNSKLADGIAIGGYLSDYQDVSILPNTALPLGKLLAKARRTVGRCFAKRLPEGESGLIRAMLLGEREWLPDHAYSNFKKTGASHLLVISGLHMAALASFLNVFSGRDRRKRKLWSGFSAGAILLFLALIGFPVSAVRGGMMYLIYLAGGVVGKRPDGVNSLGFSVLVICLANPFSGMDLGFALSVLSTLGILLCAERIAAWFLRPLERFPRMGRALGPAAGSFGASLSAQLFTLPIQIAVFRGLPLLAPVSSLILTPLCTLLLYLSIPAAILGMPPFPEGISRPFFFCAGWTAKACLAAAEKLARLPGIFLDLSFPVQLAAFFGGLTVLALGCCVSRRRKRGRAALCTALTGSLLLYAGGCVAETGLFRKPVLLAAVPDSSCVIAMQNGRAVVLALGGYRTGAAEEFLSRNNIRDLELLCLPVRDGEARRAAVDLLETMEVEQVALPQGAYCGRDLWKAGRKARRICLRDGQTIQVLDGVSVAASSGMERLTVTFGASKAIVETEPSGPGECQVLFTTQTKSEINSAFTVLQKDDIITEKNLTKLPAGRYLAAAGNGLYVELSEDGTVGLKGESTCLS